MCLRKANGLKPSEELCGIQGRRCFTWYHKFTCNIFCINPPLIGHEQRSAMNNDRPWTTIADGTHTMYCDSDPSIIIIFPGGPAICNDASNDVKMPWAWSCRLSKNHMWTWHQACFVPYSARGFRNLEYIIDVKMKGLHNRQQRVAVHTVKLNKRSRHNTCHRCCTRPRDEENVKDDWKFWCVPIGHAFGARVRVGLFGPCNGPSYNCFHSTRG